MQRVLKLVKTLNDNFKKSYECVQKIASGPYSIDNNFDPEFQKITLQATDEFELVIQRAEYRYNNLKSKGDDSAVNPNTCFDDS